MKTTRDVPFVAHEDRWLRPFVTHYSVVDVAIGPSYAVTALAIDIASRRGTYPAPSENPLGR